MPNTIKSNNDNKTTASVIASDPLQTKSSIIDSQKSNIRVVKFFSLNVEWLLKSRVVMTSSLDLSHVTEGAALNYYAQCGNPYSSGGGRSKLSLIIPYIWLQTFQERGPLLRIIIDGNHRRRPPTIRQRTVSRGTAWIRLIRWVNHMNII